MPHGSSPEAQEASGKQEDAYVILVENPGGTLQVGEDVERRPPPAAPPSTSSAPSEEHLEGASRAYGGGRG